MGTLQMDITAGSRGMFTAMLEKEKGPLPPRTNEQNADFYAPTHSRVPILQNHKSLFPQVWLDR